MPEELADIEVRLAVLETLMDFQFASQHMQTSEPAAAINRLRSLLLERVAAALPDGEAPRADVTAALERAIQRIADLQEQLPRRLVD
jgi:hypothetical protein